MAKTAKTTANTKKTLGAKALGLSKYTLPHSIMEVISTLQRAGFSAYIVGGGVRDGLLGLEPKDFDAVTNARPHEIKSIFGGRCRIIGKRFLLAHVYSGRELIEVATFRAPPISDNTTDEGMIIKDNAWGTIEQDFVRRDFSINALYYNPIKDEVLDFCGAIDDIKNRTLRLLGNAKQRIKEDPVRLLRALRFCAKLGFDFDKSLAKQFHTDNWALLEQVSCHRLYDETQKMFTSGYLTALLPLLYQYGAMPSLLANPTVAPTALMMFVAQSSDERVRADQGANPAYFYAVLLWESYLAQMHKLKKKLPFYDAQIKAAARVIGEQRQKTAIPHFAEEFITDIWLLQPRLVNPSLTDIDKLTKHPRFRAAYDFLLAREKADDCPLSESTQGMGKWWTQYQLFDSAGQAKLIELLSPKKRRQNKTLQNKDLTAELSQIQQLSLSHTAQATTPAPLFVSPHQDDNNKPVPKVRQMPVPVFEKQHYDDDYFLTLLNNDEPYIPAQRYRKRLPSSTLSLKERALGVQEVSLTTKHSTNNTPKTTKQQRMNQKTIKESKIKQTKSTEPTIKKRKKSNAKPRAVEE